MSSGLVESSGEESSRYRKNPFGVLLLRAVESGTKTTIHALIRICDLKQTLY